jgi:hypothetical protein
MRNKMKTALPSLRTKTNDDCDTESELVDVMMTMSDVESAQLEDSKSLVGSDVACNVKVGKQAVADDDLAGPAFDDILSVTVRAGTKGMGLISVVATAGLMALVSIMILVEYQPTSIVTNNLDAGQCSIISSKPLWADLLELQIPVLQNLVHASLLGGAGFVAAYRGDLVWLFFARNCAFYFGLAAISFLVVDGMALSTQGTNVGLLLRFTICSLFAVATGVAFCILEYTRHSIRRLQNGRFEGRNSNATFPLFVAETLGQYRKANFIHFVSTLIQALAVFYTISTTMAYVSSSRCGSNETPEHPSTVRVAPFEMAYGLGAHQAFLLSLFFLASTFPRCRASVSGAILASSWRLILALSFIVNIVAVQSIVDGDDALQRTTSLVYSVLEATLMLPTLVTALLLFYETEGIEPSKSAYVQVDMNEDDGVDQCTSCSNETTPDDDPSFYADCPSLLKIASSPSLTQRQRQGAYMLWSSTACLFVTMTLECILLLSQIGPFAAQEVYTWGMHVCAMYLFISHMSMSCCEVYLRARILLFVACPSGSLIAFWQLWKLTETPTWDSSSLIAGTLIAMRGLWGVFQTMGLMQLDNIPEHENTIVDMEGIHDQVPVAKRLLLSLYVPCLACYGSAVATFSTCSLPLISPPLPTGLTCHAADGFMLSRNWPGLGLFFHFGGLLVIFVSDGLSLNRASYPPSLVIGTLFTFHIGLLTMATHAWDYSRILFTENARSLNLGDYVARGALSLWTITTILLYRKLSD